MLRVAVLSFGCMVAFHMGFAADGELPDTLELPVVKVKAQYPISDLEVTDGLIGTYRLSAKELSRSVSHFGDPSRIVQSLPGVGKINDWETALVVRGGSPDQTSFLLDGVPISKVSHYEGMQSDHGGVGTLNLTYADEIVFHNGAMEAHLPDRLSGVVEVRFRDGDTLMSKQHFVSDVTGASLAAEGPINLNGKRGSYAGVFRYSAMDLLIKAGILEAFGTPRYFNGQFRTYFPLAESDLRLNVVGGKEEWHNGIGNSVLDLGGHNLNASATWETRKERNTTRIDGFVQERVNSVQFFNTTNVSSHGRDSLSQNEYGSEAKYGFSLDQKYGLGSGWNIRIGASSQWVSGRYLLSYGDQSTYIPESDTVINFTNEVGNSLEAMGEGAAYLEGTWTSESETWIAYLGYRHFFEQTSLLHGFGPRLGLQFRPWKNQTLKAAFGLYTQPHDYVDLAERATFEETKLPYTMQSMLGWEFSAPGDLQVQIEGFNKQGFHLSRKRIDLSTGNPTRIHLDSGQTQGYGGEIYIRKPRGDRFSFSLAYNYLHHREKNTDGTWSKSEYSIPHAFNSAVEVRLAKGLFLGSRYQLASGLPFIPFDTAASNLAGTGVYDFRRAYTLSEPCFSRLDLRLEWDITGRSMAFTFYFEVENVTDRRNYFARRWNSLEGGEITLQGMGRIPVAGFSVNF